MQDIKINLYVQIFGYILSIYVNVPLSMAKTTDLQYFEKFGQ